MIPIELDNLNFDLPEDLFDDTYIKKNGILKQFVIEPTLSKEYEKWNQLKKIFTSKGKTNQNKIYLKNEMGINSISKLKNGVIKVELYPWTYREWYEEHWCKRDTERGLRESSSKLYVSSSEEMSEAEGRPSKRKTPDKRTIQGSKHPKLEFNPLSTQPETQRNKIKSFIVLDLNIVNPLIFNPVNEFFQNKKDHFDKVLERLLIVTKTKIRPIKGNEIRYLKTNYMVNQENIKEGLDDLVKANGELLSEKMHKYYFVLTTTARAVIGHLVFYYDKEKNEISIPAVEISEAHRGKHYATLFFLKVFQFAKRHDIPNIKLVTGHHLNANTEQEAQLLKRIMVTFYCKLGFRLENEDPATWNKKTLNQKVSCFKEENMYCVFDSSEFATNLALDEAIKTIYAYQIKPTLLTIVEGHSNKLRKTQTKYSVSDLLSYDPYRTWLINQIISFHTIMQGKDSTIKREYIETAWKIAVQENKPFQEREIDYTYLDGCIGIEHQELNDKTKQSSLSGQKDSLFSSSNQTNSRVSVGSKPPVDYKTPKRSP